MLVCQIKSHFFLIRFLICIHPGHSPAPPSRWEPVYNTTSLLPLSSVLKNFFYFFFTFFRSTMLFRVFHAFFGTACLYYHISSSFVNSFSTSFCYFFIFLFLFSRSFLYSSPLPALSRSPRSLRLTSFPLSAIISLYPFPLFAEVIIMFFLRTIRLCL